MATHPNRYRPTDYPPEYRPLGYWRHARRQPAADPDEANPTPKRRNKLIVFLAALFATLLLHAAIALTYLGHDGGSGTSSVERKAAAGARAACPAKQSQPEPGGETPGESGSSTGKVPAGQEPAPTGSGPNARAVL
jgi:hypothetical protein